MDMIAHCEKQRLDLLGYLLSWPASSVISGSMCIPQCSGPSMIPEAQTVWCLPDCVSVASQRLKITCLLGITEILSEIGLIHITSTRVFSCHSLLVAVGLWTTCRHGRRTFVLTPGWLKSNNRFFTRQPQLALITRATTYSRCKVSVHAPTRMVGKVKCQIYRLLITTWKQSAAESMDLLQLVLLSPSRTIGVQIFQIVWKDVCIYNQTIKNDLFSSHIKCE